KSGEWKWILSLGRVVERDAEGKPLRMLGTHTDITQRKQAEESLADERLRLRTVLDTIPDLVWLKDPEGRFLACNPAFEHLMGASEKELVGRTDYDFFDRAQADSFRSRDRDAACAGRSLMNEESVTFAADGHQALIETIKTPVRDHRGELLGVLGVARDVTEVRRTAEALRQSEERLRLFIEQAPAALAMFDRDMRYLSASRRWRSDFELGDGELTGRLHYDASPEVRNDWKEVHRRGLAGEVVRAEEDRFVRPNGEVQWLRWEVRPWRDDSGAVAGIVIFTEDITERKRVEEELRTSEERLRLALEAAKQGLWDFDVVTGKETVSPEYASMLGYDPAQFQEADEDWLERMHPDDREPVLATLRACLGGQQPEYRVEFRQRSAAGDWKWILSLGRIVERDPAGRPLRMVGTHTDVTDRKLTEERVRASEARLRLALEAANQGLWDLDVATGEAAVSPEYASMLGYDPTSFHETNAAWIERLHPADAERVAGIYRDYIAGRLPEYRVEFRQRTAAGDWKWILSLGRVVERDADGRPLRMLGTHTDITDRKASEQALAAERAQLRTVIDTIPDPVWLKSEEGRFLACNPAFERLTGAREAEALGRTDYDFFDRQTADSFRERDADAIRSGAPRVNEEWVTSAADGQRVLLETTKVPVPRPGGGVLGVLGIARDVTEQRRTAEALRQSEEQLRLFIEHAPAALAMFDSEMRYLAASRRWRADFGLEDQDLTGRSHYEVFPEIGAEIKEIHRRGLSGEIVGAENDRFDRADGSTQWLRWEVRPWHDSSGATAGILIFSEDITARKLAMGALAESEEHYRALAETTFDWIWEVDPQGRYTFASPRVTELLGYTPEEVLGRTPFDLMPEAEAARVAALFGALVERREPFASLENVNRHRDGRLVVLESSGVPFHGPEGDFRGYRGMDRDITARKQAERRLATQVTISRVLAESASLAGAARQVLAAIGASEGWQVGAFWSVDRERQVLRCVELWCREGVAAGSSAWQNLDFELEKGDGLPGRVWASRAPELMTSASVDASFLRREPMLEGGLGGAVGFPIVAGEEVLGVVEFVAEQLHEPAPSLLEMFEVVGRQLGQFLERRRAEEAVERFVSGSPAVIYALRVQPDGLKLAWYGGNLESISGWPLDRVHDDSWWVDNIHAEDRERVLAAYALPYEIDHQVLEFRFLRPDGSHVWVRDEKR
ncbi:MAG: PAS domain S-box protein, partial [Thermoanaerobaculia bacterium]|nr:PAS domain S-box protein [Thermoanaerobaculia bacterium]